MIRRISRSFGRYGPSQHAQRNKPVMEPRQPSATAIEQGRRTPFKDARELKYRRQTIADWFQRGEAMQELEKVGNSPYSSAKEVRITVTVMLKRAAFVRASQVTVALSAFAKKKDAVGALWLLRQLQDAALLKGESSKVVNRITFNAALKCCKRAGAADEAVALIDEMELGSFPPDGISFRSAIGACAAQGDFERALKLLDRAVALNVDNVNTVWDAATRACGMANQMHKVETLLASSPSPLRYEYAVEACDRMQRWREGLGILEAARSVDLDTDQAYIYAIGCVSRDQENHLKALEELQTLRARRSRPPIAEAANFAMLACAHAHAGADADALLTQLAKEKWQAMEYQAVFPDRFTFDATKLAPDATTYAYCLRALGTGADKRALSKRILEVLAEARHKAGIIPDEAMCMEALRAFARLGNAELALELTDEMFRRDIYLSDEAIGHAMRACTSGGLPAKALTLFTSRPPAAQAATWRAAAECIVAAEDWTSAVELIDMAPTPALKNAAFVGYCAGFEKSKNWQKTQQHFAQLASHCEPSREALDGALYAYASVAYDAKVRHRGLARAFATTFSGGGARRGDGAGAPVLGRR
ncbi:hypothetical protein M885DRAFT_214150 [Pelagophyceae sp. CCMP2097]|nr:hypothetical protein M885DRAFT_214150 [Pelagophyceae sp. CCMP2097]